MMESPSQLDSEPSSTFTLRRSTRSKPLENPIYSRRSILNQSFSRMAIPKEDRKKVSLIKKSLAIKANKPEESRLLENRVIPYGNNEPGAAKAKTNTTTPAISIQTSFVVTKDASIIHTPDSAINLNYFPSEEESSGIIEFKCHSRKVHLNISLPKCFVIMTGQFFIDHQGVFRAGDFIKAPAGSQLTIKFLGNSEGWGKIIFFRSQS